MHEDKPEKIGWMLAGMLREGRRRKAPVFRVPGTANTPFRALVFTILSARTKDDATIRAAKALLGKAGTAKMLSMMKAEEIEKAVYGVGFHRQKAKNLKKTAGILARRDGKVPDSMDELLKLPGVGRKTANIVLSHAFGKDAIAVDTHVHRISNRLGLVRTKSPEKTELALMRRIPRRYWKKLNLAMVSYGQTVCLPRNPRCTGCKIRKTCKRIGVR